MQLNWFQWYLIGINIITFVLFTIDYFMYQNGSDGIQPSVIFVILTVIGGSLGATLALFVLDHSLNKRNIGWRIFAVSMLIIHVVLVLMLYGPNKQVISDYFKSAYENNKVLIIYLLAINIITFITFGIDKLLAVADKWRIRILVLLGLCFIGGSLGGLLAMVVFNHKTKQSYFTFGVPMMLLAQIFVLIYLKVAHII